MDSPKLRTVGNTWFARTFHILSESEFIANFLSRITDSPRTKILDQIHHHFRLMFRVP